MIPDVSTCEFRAEQWSDQLRQMLILDMNRAPDTDWLCPYRPLHWAAVRDSSIVCSSQIWLYTLKTVHTVHTCVQRSEIFKTQSCVNKVVPYSRSLIGAVKGSSQIILRFRFFIWLQIALSQLLHNDYIIAIWGNWSFEFTTIILHTRSHSSICVCNGWMKLTEMVWLVLFQWHHHVAPPSCLTVV